jgi:heat-inducible transcriptional repressor
MLTLRQKKILLCLIQEFIESAEPVASQILWEKYNLDFSPATIRNEMARLEEIGYLEQPHTSAGRVPTIKSYRLYIDGLMSQQDFPQLDDTFNLKAQLQEGELDDLLEQASHILSQLTRYTSVILAPRVRRGLFKIMQLSLISRHTLLLTMLTNSGFLINKVVEVSEDFDSRLLPKITKILNDRLKDTPLNRICSELIEHILGEQEFYKFNYHFLRFLSLSIEKLTRHLHDKLIYDGTSYLFEMPEFKDAQRLKEILQLWKKRSWWLRC